MAEKETLRIEAELDTSKLKKDTKDAFTEVSKEEKKVENQSKQTSKAIDEIGQKGKNVANALQQAGNKGTQALRQVGNEAQKTTQKINEIAKAAKSINIKQGIQIAGQVANQLAPLGQAAGKAAGMSDDQMGYIGSVLGGAASGAALGTMIAPGVGTAIGAAAGSLTAAATSLLEASVNLKESAKARDKNAQETASAIIEGYEKSKSNSQFNSFMADATPEALEAELKRQEREGKLASTEVGITRGLLDDAINKNKGETDKYKLNAGAKTIEEYNEKLVKAIQKEEETQTKINAIKARLEAINKKKLSTEEAQQKILDDIVTNNRQTAELTSLANQVRKNGGAESLLSDLQSKADMAFKAMQATKGTDDFQKNLENYNYIQKQINAVKSGDKAGMQDRVSALQEERGGLADTLNKQISGAKTRLTDSLTAIGGGSGYYAQNRGAVENIDKTLRIKLTDIDETIKVIRDKMDSTGDTWN